MARSSTTFKKGEAKGKPKGVQNRTTKEAKELLQMVLFSEFDNIKDTLKKIREVDPPKYLDSLSKLLTYILPKQTDLTSGGEAIKQDLNIVVSSQDSKDRLDKALKYLKERGK